MNTGVFAERTRNKSTVKIWDLAGIRTYCSLLLAAPLSSQWPLSYQLPAIITVTLKLGV